MNIATRLAAAALLLLLAACKEDGAAIPQPLEPDATAVAYFCGMTLAEHEGPKGQLFLRGKAKPVWFASVGETFTYLSTELAQPHDLLAVYVNDMAKGSWEHPAAGAWIEARQANYVIGSSKAAAMGGKEAVPFGSQAAASAFAKEFGGEVADFATASKALAAE